MHIVNKLKLIKPFIDICFHPERTENVLKIQRCINNMASEKQKNLVVEYFLWKHTDLVVKRKVMTIPKGGTTHINSLSAQMRAFYYGGGLYLQDLKVYPGENLTDFEFITNHMWEGHDMTHVLIDADTDGIGEIKTYGFLNAQYPSQMSVILIAIGFLNTLLNMGEVGERLDAFHDGYRIGKKAKSIVGVDWNKYWDRPIDDVRKEFNIHV